MIRLVALWTQIVRLMSATVDLSPTTQSDKIGLIKCTTTNRVWTAGSFVAY